MPTYSAVSPRHTRVVEIDNLWWMKDAWNERTTEWFSADVRRFRQLLEGVFTLTHMNVPEFLPSPEWVAQVCHNVFDLKPEDRPGRVGLFQTAYALEAHSTDMDAWKHGNILLGAANLLSSMIPLSDENLPRDSIVTSDQVHGDYYIGFDNKSPAILRGLATNPTLPALTTPLVEGSYLTPYRWLVTQTLRAVESGLRDKSVLDSLSMNLGASTEDLEFFLHQVDLQVEKAAADARRRSNLSAHQPDAALMNKKPLVKVDADRIYGFISAHPNFVSWPSVGGSQEKREEYANGLHARKSTAVTSDRTELDTEYSKRQRDRMLSRPSYYPVWAVEQSLCESLLNDPKSSLTRKLTNRIRFIHNEAAKDQVGLEAEPQREARTYTGFYAPVLGAVFAGLDAKLDTDEVPLEWLLEVL